MGRNQLAAMVLGVAALACAVDKPIRYPAPPPPYAYTPPAYAVWPLPSVANPVLMPVAAEPPPRDAAGAKYGSLTAAQCFAELGQRGIESRPVKKAPGVAIPMRLGGKLHGVSIVVAGGNKIGTSSPLDILDCRLALALDDFSALMSTRGVVRIDHMSLYRNQATIARKGIPSQHAYGLAIDIGALRRADGTLVSIQRDWATSRGSSPCPGPQLESGNAAFLRDVVCSSLDEGVFNTFITANHNADHDSHFHFDLIPGEPGVFAE